MYTGKQKNYTGFVGGDFRRLSNGWEPAPPIFFCRRPPLCKGIYQILQSHFKTCKSDLSKEIDNLEV